jgi:putative SOS response-associated peptidase YedK
VCGRFALFATPEALVEYFGLEDMAAAAAFAVARYNVAPGQAVAVVRVGADGAPRLDALRWGLVPFWAKDPSIGHRLVNARLESLAAKPAFREAFLRRRCLIAASGFYEWRKTAAGRKQPFFIRPRDGSLLAFAGLWERWRGTGATPLETCVIVTTAATAPIAAIHDRMPVMLAHAGQHRWLDLGTPAGAIEALGAAAGSELEAWPVGRAVNDARHEGAELIARAESEEP